MRQSRSFAGCAAGNQKINPGFDLPCHQVAQGRFVDGAVLTERSYDSCTASAKLHVNKITRIRDSLQLPPHILEIEESFLAVQPFGGAHRSFRESAPGFCVMAYVDRVAGG